MRKLDKEQDILKLAAGLNVDWQQNAVDNIIALCHQKISKWRKQAPKVKTIRELESLICDKIKLVFEEIYSDDDLKAVIRKYVLLGESIFTLLKDDLDDQTYATLLERRKIDGTAKDRYVAVIDCRGEKGARRFFTRWHEIAHILTLQGQLELPLHRSRKDASPTEKLMDVIAGEIGFYTPLFRPILLSEISTDGKLTFETVVRVRKAFCPEASFHSTLNACVSRLHKPTLLIQCALGLKRNEENRLNSEQGDLFPTEMPKAKLRVTSLTRNEAAKMIGLNIHRNMQVPKASVIYKLFTNPEEFEEGKAENVENLNLWHHSDGSFLGHFRVHIQVHRMENAVIALVSPV